MKKYILDFRVVENTKLHDNYALLKLKPDNNEPLPDMLPGQFVEVRVDRSPGTFLCDLKQGDSINLVLPLGNTFSLPDETDSNILLIGGGVGIAPMLYWGKYLKERNYTPKFLLGFRSDKDILQYEMFRQFGDVYISTEDGSLGEKGFVTQHSLLNSKLDKLYVCGPKPMMVAVARFAHERNISCEVSLENMMACGVGACLCCVEDTIEGNTCVCKEGPIFNIEKLKWQI